MTDQVTDQAGSYACRCLGFPYYIKDPLPTAEKLSIFRLCYSCIGSLTQAFVKLVSYQGTLKSIQSHLQGDSGVGWQCGRLGRQEFHLNTRSVLLHHPFFGGPCIRASRQQQQSRLCLCTGLRRRRGRGGHACRERRLSWRRHHR